MISPHLIIIIVLTVSCLLVTLIMSIRRAKYQTPSSEENKQQLATKKKYKEEKLSTFNSQLPTSNLKPQATDHRPLTTDQISSLTQTLSRFRFFQDSNLTRFEELLKKQDLKSAQKMIAQKFRAQQKHQPEKLAQDVFKKLLESVK